MRVNDPRSQARELLADPLAEWQQDCKAVVALIDHCCLGIFPLSNGSSWVMMSLLLRRCLLAMIKKNTCHGCWLVGYYSESREAERENKQKVSWDWDDWYISSNCKVA